MARFAGNEDAAGVKSPEDDAAVRTVVSAEAVLSVSEVDDEYVPHGAPRAASLLDQDFFIALPPDLGWGALLQSGAPGAGRLVGEGGFGQVALWRAKCDEALVAVKLFGAEGFHGTTAEHTMREVQRQRRAASLGLAPRVFAATTDLPRFLAPSSRWPYPWVPPPGPHRAFGVMMERFDSSLGDLQYYLLDYHAEAGRPYNGRSKRYDDWRGHDSSRGWHCPEKRPAKVGQRAGFREQAFLADVGVQLLDQLQRLHHAEGFPMVHSDVKPDNVLVKVSGVDASAPLGPAAVLEHCLAGRCRYVLADYGEACDLRPGGKSCPSLQNGFAGTHCYQPPEIAAEFQTEWFDKPFGKRIVKKRREVRVKKVEFGGGRGKDYWAAGLTLLNLFDPGFITTKYYAEAEKNAKRAMDEILGLQKTPAELEAMRFTLVYTEMQDAMRALKDDWFLKEDALAKPTSRENQDAVPPELKQALAILLHPGPSFTKAKAAFEKSTRDASEWPGVWQALYEGEDSPRYQQDRIEEAKGYLLAWRTRALEALETQDATQKWTAVFTPGAAAVPAAAGDCAAASCPAVVLPEAEDGAPRVFFDFLPDRDASGVPFAGWAASQPRADGWTTAAAEGLDAWLPTWTADASPGVQLRCEDGPAFRAFCVATERGPELQRFADGATPGTAEGLPTADRCVSKDADRATCLLDDNEQASMLTCEAKGCGFEAGGTACPPSPAAATAAVRQLSGRAEPALAALRTDAWSLLPPEWGLGRAGAWPETLAGLVAEAEALATE